MRSEKAIKQGRKNSKKRQQETRKIIKVKGRRIQRKAEIMFQERTSLEMKGSKRKE